MSLVRADSSSTMLSRAWSTTDLVKGLEHVLTDGKNELPDDLAQLEERFCVPTIVVSNMCTLQLSTLIR